jgi:hypothetical protein
MIVSDLDAVGPTFRPDEATAPLVIDPDAVLPRTIAPQCLHPVASAVSTHNPCEHAADPGQSVADTEQVEPTFRRLS